MFILVILVFLILKHGEGLLPEEESRVINDIDTTKLEIKESEEEILRITNEIINKKKEKENTRNNTIYCWYS